MKAVEHDYKSSAFMIIRPGQGGGGGILPTFMIIKHGGREVSWVRSSSFMKILNLGGGGYKSSGFMITVE